MAEISFNIAECTVTFEEVRDGFPSRLHHFYGVAQHPKYGELAKIRGLKVERRYTFKDHSDFLATMDDESQEMMEFATTLFDPQSSIRPWLIDGGYRSGSGCWGTELSVGEIVYVEDLTVKEPFRRRGVGSLVLQQFFQSSIVLSFLGRSNVFCWPVPPRDESDSNPNWDVKVEGVTAFFRKNGFRRVGRTSFLGYSPDPNHPSHQLPIENDPDRLGNEYADAPELSPEDMQREYPLHSAIANKTAEIAATLTAAHASDPAKIHQQDNAGFTPLYVAAGVPNLPALRTLIDIGVADDLQNVSNKEHMTPLEKLQDTMRQERETMEAILGIWDGYSPETLSCEYILKKALGTPPISESEDEYIVKRRLGCTCGSCTDQWLSPRMRFRLQVVSMVGYDSMGMDLDYFKAYKPLSIHEIPSLNTEYLPLALRDQMYKSFYQGYRVMFLAVSHILKNPENGIPTPARVLAQALATEPSYVGFYIDKGGRVEYALDAVIHSAKEQSILGDGSFEDLWDDPGEVGDEGGMVNMPECANDLAFGLVRRRLGIDPRIAMGPYYQEDVEMYDEDEDSEDD